MDRTDGLRARMLLGGVMLALVTAVAAWTSGPSAGAGKAPVAVVGDVVTVGEGEGDDGTAYLGVQLREETDHPEGGARVTHVVDDSPAGKGGIREGDIVVRFDGQVIRGPMALTERIHAKAPGDRVPVTVLREGREHKLEVELSARQSPTYLSLPGLRGVAGVDPESWGELHESLKQYQDRPEWRKGLFNWWAKPKLGVELVEPTPELRQYMGGGEEAGVLVSKVLSGTPAARAGIRVGDLIVSVAGHEVADAAELRQALEDKQGETFDLEVIRDRRRMTIKVTIEEPQTDRPTGPRALLAPPSPPPAPPPMSALAPVPPAAPLPSLAPPPPPPAAPPALAPQLQKGV